MKKFKFISGGMAPTSRKNWLNPLANQLPNPFSLKDIVPGTFNNTIMKRLNSAKTDGIKIILRRFRGSFVGIQVIDKEAREAARKKKQLEINKIRKELKSLLELDDVKSYMKNIKKLNGSLYFTMELILRQNKLINKD